MPLDETESKEAEKTQKPAEESAPAPPEPVEPARAPEKPPHPRALVLKALELGASQSFIDSMSTDELSARVLSEVEARKSAPATPPPAQEDEEIDWGEDEETKSKFTEKDVAPPIARVIKKQHKELRELRKVKDDLAKFREESDRRAQHQVFDAFDAAIESVGPEYTAILGKPGEMTPEQIELVNTAIRAANIDHSKDHPRAITKKVSEQIKRLYGRFVTKKTDPPKDAPKEEKTNGHPERITKEQFEAAASAVPTRKGVESPVSTRDLLDQWLRKNDKDLGD